MAAGTKRIKAPNHSTSRVQKKKTGNLVNRPKAPSCHVGTKKHAGHRKGTEELLSEGGTSFTKGTKIGRKWVHGNGAIDRKAPSWRKHTKKPKPLNLLVKCVEKKANSTMEKREKSKKNLTKPKMSHPKRQSDKPRGEETNYFASGTGQRKALEGNRERNSRGKALCSQTRRYNNRKIDLQRPGRAKDREKPRIPLTPDRSIPKKSPKGQRKTPA